MQCWTVTSHLPIMLTFFDFKPTDKQPTQPNIQHLANYTLTNHPCICASVHLCSMEINSVFGRALQFVAAVSDPGLRKRADKLWGQLDDTIWEYLIDDDDHNKADQMVTLLYPDFHK